MDDLNCSGEVVHQTLHEIEFINRWLGGNSITLQALDRILKTRKPSYLKIADLGCGGGGMLREVYNLCKKRRIECELYGFDANPNIIRYAREDNKDIPQIRFQSLDIFSDEYSEKEFDIVLCTLVAHHFTEEQIVRLFSGLKSKVKIKVIINDLQRNAFAYYAIKTLTLLFSKSAMVKYDAPLSVLRGFKKKEIVEILTQAGIKEYTISWRWAFRYELIF